MQLIDEIRFQRIAFAVAEDHFGIDVDQPIVFIAERLYLAIRFGE